LLVYFYVVQFALMLAFHTALRLIAKGNRAPYPDEPAMNGYQRAIKRVVDLTLAAVLLLIASPLMIVIAILIKLDSRGPILFRQQRVGENARRFDMLKFRSMSADAESRITEVLREIEGGIVHKHKDDPRVTRLGRVLRRTSLDELPQLINVLMGDMSLVGPRPELPMFVDKYEPWQFERLRVPQGMTGWWQVNGRSDNPLHMNTDHDIYYVRNYSLLLDVRILLKTIWVVLRAKGAY
jgi:exopolysaccharide biosynthesis polyprenyl glycosylphosphotransferase